MIHTIWVDEKAFLNVGGGMAIERLVRQLENPAIGVPEYLVEQLPPLKCTKFVVSSEEELRGRIKTYFEGEEMVSVPCNRVMTESGSIDINSATDLKTARQWIRQEGPKVCFVGQRLYFAKQVERDLDDIYSVTWMELAPNVGNWADLLKADADIFIFFMPHQCPPGIRKGLRGTVVGVHAEPLPKFINGKCVITQDIWNRLQQLRPALDLKHFYHHDKTSFPVLEREGVRPKEFISAIATGTYHPQKMDKKWDLIFFGRETEHRMNMMLPAKHVFGERFLHIAHGVAGDELNRVMNMSKIGINAHCEKDVPAMENRIQTLLACKLMVLSEPLSHNDFFVPGRHFVEFRSAGELVQKAKYYLVHGEERETIAQAGYEFVVKNLAARVVWPRLIEEVLNSGI